MSLESEQAKRLREEAAFRQFVIQELVYAASGLRWSQDKADFAGERYIKPLLRVADSLEQL